jgi:hypothetical protein
VRPENSINYKLTVVRSAGAAGRLMRETPGAHASQQAAGGRGIRPRPEASAGPEGLFGHPHLFQWRPVLRLSPSQQPPWRVRMLELPVHGESTMVARWITAPVHSWIVPRGFTAVDAQPLGLVRRVLGKTPSIGGTLDPEARDPSQVGQSLRPLLVIRRACVRPQRGVLPAPR